MSDHLQMSGQSSLDKNFQIRTNNDGQNQLYIPCWEEQGSNSTQYHHLIEQTKFFKNKCKHLENHLEENHREFSSLNQLYMIAETNERRLLKENQDLRRGNREMGVELSQLRLERDSVVAELQVSRNREVDLRERLFKSKEKESELTGELEGLREECEMLKRKPQGREGNEQQKWKRHYNDQVGRIEQQWKAAYEQLELQFDKKSKEVREKNDEIKLINKTNNAHKEDYEARIRGLQGELEQLRRQTAKNKALISDYERQIKDLKLVRDEVSSKNDQIEGQNSRLKKIIKEQALKYAKMDTINRQLQEKYQQLNHHHNSVITEATNQRSIISQLRTKITSLENELLQVRSERDRLIASKSHLENSNSAIQHQLSTLKKDRDNQREVLKASYQTRLRQLKESTSLEKSNLQASISSLKIEIQVLKSQKRESARQEASANEKASRLQEEIEGLKHEASSWREKYQKLNAKSREETPTIKDCNHLGEMADLRQEIRRLTEQKEEFRANLTKSTKLVQDLNVKSDEDNHTIQVLTQENERLGKEKKRLAEDKDRINSDKLRLAALVQSLEKQRDALQNQKRDHHSQQKFKNHLESEYADKIKHLQSKLREKTSQIQRLSRSLQTIEEEFENYKQRPRQDTRQSEKDKTKRFQAKLKEKEKEIKELEQRLEQLQNQHEDQRQKLKSIQKQNRSKESQLAKRDRKIKELEKTASELISQVEELEGRNQREKSELQAVKKQLKTEQSNNQKLRAQLARNNAQKENWANQQANNKNKIEENERHQWEQVKQRYISELRIKQEQVRQLKDTIASLQSSQKIDDKSAETEHYLRLKIKELQDQLRLKEQTIRRFQKRDEEPASGSLQQLQAQYNRQLLALKRLITYKGYKEEQTNRVQQLKAQHQARIQLLLSDYRGMYQQMMLLKEKVLTSRVTVINEPVDISSIEEVWRMKVDQIAEQRQVLIQKVAMWQRKYQELRFLFQAKIQSKEQTINLLNLKLSNLEMSKCQYSCHHR